MKKRSLNERMKKGELYVVLGGVDEDFGLHFISNGDGTPRIYSKDSLDSRVWNQAPICRSLQTARRCLGPIVFCVLLPLSEVLKIWSPSTIRCWARSQCDVSPQEVRDYVKQYTSNMAA